MTDRRNERYHERRDRKKDEEADKRLREERDRRSDELTESWRRNHPSEQEEERKDQPKWASGMTERAQSIERGKAERRELEAAGWKSKGHGAKTIWQSPADSRWYAHHQAVEMQRKGDRDDEETRVLDEHSFERVSTNGTAKGRERWVRPEEGPRLYTRSQALIKARRGPHREALSFLAATANICVLSSERSLVDTVDAELDRLISKGASQDRRPNPDEQEALWQVSVRAYTARRREEMRAAWCEHHQGQAARLRTTLEALIVRHEDEAARLAP